MDKTIKILIFLFSISFVLLSENCFADTLYIERYNKVQELLYQNADTVSNFKNEDLFILVGMATVCAKDTSSEKQVLADKLFSFLAQELERKLKNKEVDKNSYEALYLRNVLKTNQYHIKIPVSELEKTIEYIKQGKFEYIGQRMIDRGYIYWILGFIVIACGLVWKIRKQKRK